MNLIVIDTSVIMAVLGNEPSKPSLIAATSEAQLVAPPSVHWEVGNAMSSLFKRKKSTLAKAQAALTTYKSIPIRFVDVELLDAIRISENQGIYAYDAYILSCAQTLRCPILTLDTGIIAAAKSMKIQYLEV